MFSHVTNWFKFFSKLASWFAHLIPILGNLSFIILYYCYIITFRISSTKSRTVESLKFSIFKLFTLRIPKSCIASCQWNLELLGSWNLEFSNSQVSEFKVKFLNPWIFKFFSQNFKVSSSWILFHYIYRVSSRKNSTNNKFSLEQEALTILSFESRFQFVHKWVVHTF